MTFFEPPGWRRGLLLPDLEGADTVEQQIEICCYKAGIHPGEPTRLYCFEVKRLQVEFKAGWSAAWEVRAS